MQSSLSYRSLRAFHVQLTAGITLLLSLWPGLGASAAADEQLTFATPDEAVKALLEATTKDDKAAMHRIFGPALDELVSGDAVADTNAFKAFARRVGHHTKLEADGESKMALLIGWQEHPFAIPLVKKDGKWSFDTAAGKEEILNRRIGENELGAISVCRGYVGAQRDYFLGDWDDDGVLQYATKMVSTPGKRDGLYFETKDDELPSPLGPLVAEARAEGYGKSSHADKSGSADHKPSPYHGYVYRILTKQGEKAAGGKYDYVINGHMVGGFALVAYPATWSNSGVMTFIVNQNGKVYEKNLGEKTVDLAAAMEEYNPDDSWKLAED